MQTNQKALGLFLAGAAGAAAAGWIARAVWRSRTALQIIVFLDTGEGISPAGKHLQIPGEQQRPALGLLVSAVCREFALPTAHLYLLSSKQPLTEKLLQHEKRCQASATGGIVVLIASVSGQLSAAAQAQDALRLVPYAPKWLPVLGHRHLLLAGKWRAPFHNLYENLFRQQQDSSPTLRLVLGSPGMGQPLLQQGAVDTAVAVSETIFTSDPDVVAELQARESELPKMWNRPIQLKLQRLTDNGIFTSSTTSPDWATARGLLSRGFNHIKLSSYFPIVLDKLRAFTTEWGRFPAGACVAGVNEWLACVTSDAVVQASIGLDMRNLERQGCGEALHPFLQAYKFALRYQLGFARPWQELGWAALNPFTAPAAMEAKFQAARQVCEDTVEEMVERTRAGELGSSVSNTLSMLLTEKSPLTGQLVRQKLIYGHVLNLLVAGHETTAATLGFLMHFLATHPEWEQRLREEARAVLAGRGELTFDDIPRLVVAEACFKEALRLHPPVGIIGRDASQPMVLSGKWLLLRGQRVTVSLVSLHRREDIWGGAFGSPDCFNPARFMPGAAEAARRHPFAFLPFGLGVRSCLGQQFALIEAKAWLATVYDQFTFQVPPGFIFRPSSTEGGASPTLEGLRLLIFPAPGAHRTGSSTLTRLPRSFVRSSASAAAAAAAAATGANKVADGSQAFDMTATPAKSFSSRVPSYLLSGPEATPPASTPAASNSSGISDAGCHGTPLLVLFGSNGGTCEAFAELLVQQAAANGFSAVAAPLDSVVQLPASATAAPAAAGRHVASSCSGSFNGQPPEQAVGTVQLPTNGAVVVITSTYNGFPPENAWRFAAWLDAAAKAAEGAQGSRFAVFGVGNSQWATFHAFPKRIDRQLAAAGAQQLRALAAADVSRSGFSEVFEAWKEDLLGELITHFKVAAPGAGSGLVRAGPHKPRLALRLLPEPGVSRLRLEDAVPLLQRMTGRGVDRDGLPLDFTHSLLRITAARQLQGPDSGRFTRHVELELPSGMTYAAGSHLEIQPRNSPHLVETALQLLGLSGLEPVEWLPQVGRTAESTGRQQQQQPPGAAVQASCDGGATAGSHITAADGQSGASSSQAQSGAAVHPLVISSRQACFYLADLAAVPTRRQVVALAERCPCPPEADSLWQLADEDNYKKQVSGQRLTTLELLLRHRSLATTFDLQSLLAFLPRLAPRYYSISSSPKACPDRASITVARVELVTPSGRLHRGPGSCTVHDTEVGQFLVGTVSQLHSAFRLPADATTPLIMVGAGTGIAPFIGFLQERQAVQQAGVAQGPAVLFFGCRSAEQDFIYREQLQAWQHGGVLTDLQVAFSRDGPCKVYVQDLLRQQGGQLWHLLDRCGAVVYVCGDARRMAPGVAAAFQGIAQEWGGRGSSSAAAWLGSMREAKRYLEDVWS